jgi:IS5 family transposase
MLRQLRCRASGSIHARTTAEKKWAGIIDHGRLIRRLACKPDLNLAVKNLFRHRKVRYKGLCKNVAQLNTLFALPTWWSPGDAY